MCVPKMSNKANQINEVSGEIKNDYQDDVSSRIFSGKASRQTVSLRCEVCCEESCWSDRQISSHNQVVRICKAFHRNVSDNVALEAFSSKIACHIRCMYAAWVLNGFWRACWKRLAGWMILGSTDRDILFYFWEKEQHLKH